MANVGIIGLGRMGSAIAQRYAADGHVVTGWTRSGRALGGVRTARTISELANQCDTLILSLYDDQAVADVLDTLLDCDLSGKLIIETSTVAPTILQTRSAALTQRGAAAVDAPISGGPELVAQAACGIFIGGDPATAARATERLGTISQRIFHVGPLGAGLAMKTINNGMLQTYFAGLQDYMPMAQKAGLPLETVLRILGGGPAGLPMVTDRIDKVIGKDKTVGFTISAALKDAEVFRRVAASYGYDTPIVETFAKGMEDVVAEGHGEKDPAYLIARAYGQGGKS